MKTVVSPFFYVEYTLFFCISPKSLQWINIISSKRRKPRSNPCTTLTVVGPHPTKLLLFCRLIWADPDYFSAGTWVPWYCPQLPVPRGILHGYLFLKKENNFSVQWYSDRGKKHRYSQPLPLHPVIKGEFICYQILDHRIYLLSDRSCTGRAMDNDWLNCSQII